jgi:hypothetical protein
MRRQKRIAAERSDESICTFARSFDCRAIDTWIIRAVFDEVSDGVTFPPRAEDSLEKDLKFDPDTIDEVVEVVAQRASRSLENYEQNPFYGKLVTVSDLVMFFANQPKS